MVEALRVDPHSPEHLNRMADHLQLQINTANTVDAGSLDLRQVPLVGEMIDDEGNLNLPLGLRVYNTMGDTSIGFGSKF
jgi:hypothetical protein